MADLPKRRASERNAIIQFPAFRHSRARGEPTACLHNPAYAMKGGWVYVLADRCRGGTYIGVTSNLARRMWQHRNGDGSQHAKKYGKLRLVYMERFEEIEDAIRREKAMKKWMRQWKIELIEKSNPDWVDLYETLNV
jgi:putative endonuclease